MPQQLLVRDESVTGEVTHELTLDLLNEQITVRELIRERVYQEVKDHNARQADGVFHGLVQPTDAERTLNGFRLRKPRQIDWKRQYDKAIDAFEKSQVLVLVDDRQAESLDQSITVGPNTSVSFLRLVPLVGG